MFYSEVILTRRGPLAKVWLAAHYERKLSKTQTLQTDIGQSVDAIMGQDTAPMALRLSGQLLLGVVRIYSRKTKYLLDDCNEALLKIKMAFRPGIVDMTEEQLSVPQNAITLQGEGIDLDLLLPDMNWDMDFERPTAPGQQHVARKADITLASADDFQFNLDEPGFGLDLGPPDGIGSQDFDLGIDFDGGRPAEEGVGDETMSVEMGRDAVAVRSARQSMESALQMGGDDLDFDRMSMHSEAGGFGGDDMLGPAMGMDDFDLGVSFEPDVEAALDREKTPEQLRDISRASSPLTPPPATPPPEIEDAPTPKPKKRQIAKKQIIDEVTELETGVGGRFGRQPQADLSGILGEQHFLPRSRTVMRLLEIRADPVAHFMPTRVTNEGTFFCAAPPGLAPELEELFMFPTTTRRRGESLQPREPPAKRPRTTSEEPEVELGRRAISEARSAAITDRDRASMGPVGGDITTDFGGFDGFGDEGGMMDLDIPAPDIELDTGAGLGTSPEARAAEASRLSTPVGFEGEELTSHVDDGISALAVFDSRSSKTQSDGSTQAPSQDDFGEFESQQGDQQHRGFSKNTIKALGILRKELEPAVGGEAKVLSFNRISDKASRRAASAFFFELLLLGTRDHIKVQQPDAFENIEIQAKDKLWIQGSERLSSAVPSVSA